MRTPVMRGTSRGRHPAFGVAVSLLMVAAGRAQTWEPGALRQTGPQATERHAMVYDIARERVVLFGGYNGSSRNNLTWEFDGTSWSTGAAAPALLTPRAAHAMAYDSGRSLTVLFGGDDGAYKSDAWEYDGVAWRAGPRAPAGLAPRAWHAMTYDSRRGVTVLFGGANAASLGDTWEYDGVAWARGVDGPPPRMAHMLGYDEARGVTVLVGGFDLLTQWFVEGVWEYDGVVWTKFPWGPFQRPLPRRSSCLCYDPDRSSLVLVAGTSYGAGDIKDDTWLFDGSTWTKRPAVGLPIRERHACAYDRARRRMVVFGGYDGFDLSDTWELGEANTWTRWRPPSQPPEARWGHGMTFDSRRGRTLLFGGRDPVYIKKRDLWSYDGTSWSLVPTAPPPLALLGREHPSLIYDGRRDRAVLFGGSGMTANETVWEFDGASWLSAPSFPPALEPGGGTLAHDTRRGVDVLVMSTRTWERDATGWFHRDPRPPATLDAMAYDGRRGVMVGLTGTSDVVEYDGSAWVPGASVPPSFEPRSGAAMAFDAARGAIVLFGGAAGTALDDTWTYEGTAWTELVTATAPPARYSAALVHDSSRGVDVLFGGLGNGPRDDTWELDGSSWIPRAIPGPPARQSHTMAFHAGRQRVILFGGAVGGTKFNDTWEYDGASWTPGGAPPAKLLPRIGHAMTYDSTHGLVVLFGGNADPTGARNDTWLYDASWAPGPTPPTGLQRRTHHAAALDSDRGVIVLTGGDRFNDTWEYDGAAWRLSPAAALTPRNSHAMAYDTVRHRMVLFGGQGPEGFLDDTWEYVAGDWQRVATLTSPPARRDHVLVFDGARVLLHSGFGEIDALGDTWHYDGSTWTLLATPGPPARVWAGAAHDSARQVTVIFGGSSGNALGDTWELRSSHGSSVAGTGAGPGTPNRLRVHDSSGLPTGTNVEAFGAGSYGVLVDSGLLMGGNPREILAAPGPGPTLGPQVRAFTALGAPVPRVNFYAYATLRYGANVAAGSVEQDVFDEILAGAGPGSVFGPQVRGFNVDAGTATAIPAISFYAYATLRYGVVPGDGDVDADMIAEILTGPGPGPAFAPQVRGWQFDGGAVAPIPALSFSAFATPAFGCRSTAGSLDSDGQDEILATPGPGPTLQAAIRGFNHDGTATTLLPGFDIAPFRSFYGARVATAELRAEPFDELVAAAGPDPAADSSVVPFAYDGVAPISITGSYLPFLGFAYGADVSGGPLD